MSNGQKLWGYSNIGNSYQWINNPTYGGINAFENYATYSFNNTLTTSGGGGFWFFSTKQCSITLRAVSLTLIQQQNSLDGRNLNVTLFKGWNVIGVPILTNNGFNSMLNSCSIKGGFYTYNPLTSTYVNTTTPTVGSGYFVYANAQCTLDWTQNVNSSSPPSAP